ncbi:hypothetical protein ACFL13_02835 [Patescibacteria group bacterium]
MLKTLTQSLLKSPKMTFYGEDRNEEIIFVIRKSFITNINWVLGVIIAILAPVFLNYEFYLINTLKDAGTPLGFVIVANLFWYLVVFGLAFERFLNWFFNVYILTNKRIVDMDFHHLTHRNISEAPLRNIEDITYDSRGTFNTIFNIGDVYIQTAAESREFTFGQVANPDRIQNILSDLVARFRNHEY